MVHLSYSADALRSALLDEPSLWQAMVHGRDGRARERLIEHYLSFARMLAAKLYSKRYSNELDFDDYLQFATVGLIESVDRYQFTSDAQFTTYASKRIQGAILDGIELMSDRQQQISTRQRMLKERSHSLLTVPAGMERIETVFEQLAHVAMGMAMGYMLENTALYVQDEPEQPQNPYTSVELGQLRSRLLELVDSLPERERLLIKYNYFNHVPFETVAELWGVSRGRVAQIHRSALEHLRGLSRNMSRHDIAW